jgi:hypothetical protein
MKIESNQDREVQIELQGYLCIILRQITLKVGSKIYPFHTKILEVCFCYTIFFFIWDAFDLFPLSCFWAFSNTTPTHRRLRFTMMLLKSLELWRVQLVSPYY